MSCWLIGPQFTAATSWYVTFTADTRISSYRILGWTYSKSLLVAAANVISLSNIRRDDGTTGTFYCGYQSSAGDFMPLPVDGLLMRADQNAFVTLTWASAQTGKLSVSYETIYK